MKAKQDYLNLLNETVNYYTVEKNNRAILEGTGCVYYNDGDMCAVGRCLVKPQGKDKYLWDLGGDTDVIVLMKEYNEKAFKEKYRGFDIDFWIQLQNLHDSNSNWIDFDLTINGLNQVDRIKDWINNFGGKKI